MIYVTVVVLFALVLGTFRAGFVHSLRMGYQVTLPVATVVYYGLLVLYGGLAQLLMLENYQRYIEQIWPYRPVIFLVLLYFLVISAVGIVAVLFMRDEPPGRATHRRRVAWAAEWYQRHGVYTILPWLGTAIVLVYLLIVVSQFEGVATDLHDMTYAVLIVGFLQALATMLMGRAERIAVVTGHTTTLQELADEYASTVAEIVDYNLIHRNSTVFNRPAVDAQGWRDPLHIGTILRIPPAAFAAVVELAEEVNPADLENDQAVGAAPRPTPTPTPPPAPAQTTNTGGGPFARWRRGRNITPPPNDATGFGAGEPAATPVPAPVQTQPDAGVTNGVTTTTASVQVVEEDQLFTTIVSIAAGGAHSLALSSNGRFAGWGDNDHGQAVIPPTFESPMSVYAAQNYSILLNVRGEIFVWGHYMGTLDIVPAHTGRFIAAATGGTHVMALSDTDARLYAWGDNSHNQCDVPDKQFKAFACGHHHSVGVTTDGEIAVWGDNSAQQLQIPVGITGATTVTAGARHSVALLSDGRVIAWGDNSAQQCDVPDFSSPVVAVAAGVAYSAALCEDGRVRVWGSSTSSVTNVPDPLPRIRMIAAGTEHILAVSYDNRVYAWGNNQSGQCRVPRWLS